MKAGVRGITPFSNVTEFSKLDEFTFQSLLTGMQSYKPTIKLLFVLVLFKMRAK